MALLVFLSLLAIAATVTIHALGTVWWLRHLKRTRGDRKAAVQAKDLWAMLVQTALVLVALHVAEVMVWALILRFCPDSGLTNLQDAIYFSFTTFTTLGYGDIIVQGPARMLTGIESLNGVLLVGWSTALSFAVIQRLWEQFQDTECHTRGAHLPPFRGPGDTE